MRPLAAIFFFAAALSSLLPARAAVETLEYDVTWVGVSVGSMSVRAESFPDGSLLRSIRIRNRPWIAKIYPVDHSIDCRVAPSPDGPFHLVSKRMGEKNFSQDDVLSLWPDAGRAVWSNALSNAVHSFSVPVGSRDFVSFFFDLRDAAAAGPWTARGDYALVMDGALHPLEILVAPPETVRTPRGPKTAVPVRAVSRSPTLFARNKPRRVWVSANRPAVLLADVDTRFGAVRASLAKWEIDGKPVDW